MHRFSEVNFLDIKENSKYIELVEKVIGQAFKVENIEKYGHNLVNVLHM